MLMKHILTAMAGCFGLATASAHAGAAPTPDEILVYKYSSLRPWTQYDCYRPDIASTPALPVIPKNARVGTYTQTEFWVIDRATNMRQVVEYYSYVFNGATVKKYVPHNPAALTRTAYNASSTPTTVPSIRYLQGLAANTYNVSINRGGGDDGSATGDLNSDGFDDFFSFAEQSNLLGLGKPYTVVPGMVFQKVPTSLTGPYIYSDRTDVTNGSADIFLRTLYFEAGTTQSLTLDALSTKNANTGADLIPYSGGAALSKATLAYGVRVAEIVLEKLGYDNDDDPSNPAINRAKK